MPEHIGVSPRLVADVNNLLITQEPIGSVGYSNVQLYGPGFDDIVDPDCRITYDTVSLYYPGKVPGTDAVFGTVDPGHSGINPEVTLLGVASTRQEIADFKLSRRALRRIADSRRDNDLPAPTKDDAMLTLITFLEVPFSAIAIATVVQHAKIKAGERIAHLYFPTVVSPERALSELQAAQAEVIAEEVIPE